MSDSSLTSVQCQLPELTNILDKAGLRSDHFDHIPTMTKIIRIHYDKNLETEALCRLTANAINGILGRKTKLHRTVDLFDLTGLFLELMEKTRLDRKETEEIFAIALSALEKQYHGITDKFCSIFPQTTPHGCLLFKGACYFSDAKNKELSLRFMKKALREGAEPGTFVPNGHFDHLADDLDFLTLLTS
jgi:hypothetical protein